MIPRHVIVFAREPRFGTVKTRLAADIGKGPAYVVYRRMLRNLLRRLGGDGRWTTWLAVTPPGAARGHPDWHLGVPAFAQSTGDLGQRMAAAFRTVPPGPAIVVGSDIPGLGPRQIGAAFRHLDNHDAVFGPTADGGYYLIGLAAGYRNTDPFAGVRWSTRHALGDTLANLPADAAVAILEELIDIDTGADLAQWRGRNGKR